MREGWPEGYFSEWSLEDRRGLEGAISYRRSSPHRRGDRGEVTMNRLDTFFQDLKIILWSIQSRDQIVLAARNRLECFVDDIFSEESPNAEYLLTKCQQRLKMLEYIAGSAPVLQQLESDLVREIERASRKRTA